MLYSLEVMDTLGPSIRMRTLLTLKELLVALKKIENTKSFEADSVITKLYKCFGKY
jgi:hypothetical protein